MNRTTQALRWLILAVFALPIGLTIIGLCLDDLVAGNCDLWLGDLREKWRKWVRENWCAEWPWPNERM